jgi:hypoxanthine phosphoribosyltransferase
VLLDESAIGAAVERLAGEITGDHPDGVLLVGVLKGSLLFLADLARAITDIPVEIEFMAISRFAPDSGRVKILQDLTIDITGRDVVVVEDIVDTGLTLTYLLAQLTERRPRRLDACALLDRTQRRIVPLDVRYRGMELADEYVLGYGLHFRDLYRNLPFVVRADPDVLHDAADAYVAEVYGRDGTNAPTTREGGGEAGGRVHPAERRVP